MSTEPKTRSLETRNAMTIGHARNRLTGRDPLIIVNLARKYTAQSVLRLVQLMEGWGYDETGKKVPILVPPAVSLRAAEILLDRGFGKAPVAVYVATDGTPLAGVHALSIQEKILALKQASERTDRTTDLEASEIQELDETDEVLEAAIRGDVPPPSDGSDLI